MTFKICQNRCKNMPDTNKLSKISKNFNFFVQVAKFHQIWSHWTEVCFLSIYFSVFNLF